VKGGICEPADGIIEVENALEDMVEHDVEDDEADEHDERLDQMADAQKHAARDQRQHARVQVVLETKIGQMQEGTWTGWVQRDTKDEEGFVSPEQKGRERHPCWNRSGLVLSSFANWVKQLTRWGTFR
jgi:hypothetical protein